MEAYRVLKNLGKSPYASVILQKMKSRVLERASRREIELNLSWLQAVCEEFEPLAKLLDADLWNESKVFGKELRVRAEIILTGLNVRFGGGGYYELLYFITRHFEPLIVVETGVAAGFSTQAFLKAMHMNGRGRLYSSDFPYVRQFRLENHEQYIGVLVQQKIRERWELFLEGDRKNLPQIVSKIPGINIFHYDSDKRYSGREFAISVISKALAQDGIIVMDDIHNDSFFHDYVGEASRPWKVFRYEDRYVGMIGLYDPRTSNPPAR